MRRVAARAHRCHCQTALHEALPVNALSVVPDDRMLRSHVPNGRLLPFPVTSGAEMRYVCRKRLGSGIRLAEDAVSTVTLFTGGSIRILLCHENAMDASLIFRADRRVACRAVNRLRDGITRSDMRSIDLAVALATGDLRMHGPGELLLIHRQ